MSSCRLRLMTAMLVMFAAGTAGAATLKVKVQNEHAIAIPGVQVVVAGIPPDSRTGDPDPNCVAIDETGSDGTVTFSGAGLITGYRYMVIVTKQGYSPTARTQMDDPNGAQIVFTDAGSTIVSTRMLTAMPSIPGHGTLRFTVSSVSTDTVRNNTMIVADIRSRDTDAPAAFGFGTVQEGEAFINVFNVPEQRNPGVYTARIGVVQEYNKVGKDVLVSTTVPVGLTRSISVDFDDAMNVSNVEQSNDSSVSGGPAISGVVVSTSGVPLAGAIVELFKHNDQKPLGDYGNALKGYKTYTDVGGNFSFYNIEIATYAVQINKPGYLGIWDQNGGTQTGPGYGFYYGGQQLYVSQPYRLTMGLGTIKGRVVVYDMQDPPRYVGLANAHINVNGMGDTWAKIPGDEFDNFYSTGYARQGCGWGETVTDSEGNFTVTGLGSGNFDLSIWNDMLMNGYSFSNGPDGQRNSDNPRSGDDLRIQISTGGAPITMVYSSWTRINADVMSNPFEIIVSTIAPRIGTISGTVTFQKFERYPDRVFTDGSGTYPAINEPISLVAYEDNRDWSRPRKVYSWNCSTGPKKSLPLDFTLHVDTGTTYWLNMRSTKWAVLNQKDSRADLSAGASISGRDYVLVPGGSMKVVIKDPSGNILRRTEEGLDGGQRLVSSAYVHVSGPSHNGNDLQQEGETVFYGLAPGNYTVYVNAYQELSSGSGSSRLPEQYTPASVENINISADNTTIVEVRLKPGTIVTPAGSALAMPPLPEDAAGFYGIGGWEAGKVLTAETLSETFFSASKGGGNGESTPKGMSVSLGYDNALAQWEAKRSLDGKYDFYLGYMNMFNPGEGDEEPQNAYQSFTVISVLPGVEVKYDSLRPNATTFLTFGSGTLGNCTVGGKVSGTRIFSRENVQDMLDAGIDKLFACIPTIMIYDQQGSFKGFANALPRLERIPYWGEVVGEGEFSGDVDDLLNWFKTELASYPVEYACEKLPAGKYTLVFGHPNYPQLMKQVTLTSGSNTLDVNFDEAQVVGTSVSGVVKSTSGVVIMGANISIRNRNANIEKETTTDGSGAFSIVGIPPGIYRIDADCGGYTAGGKKVAVTRAGAAVEILLKESDASISGTVFSQRMPAKVLPGAKIIVYNETENGRNPTEYLPTYRAIADNYGQYFVTGLISGDTYYVYCIAEGRIMEWQIKSFAPGLTSGMDFTLKPAKPHLKVNVKKVLENSRIAYNFVIGVPNKLVNPRNPAGVAAPYCQYSPVPSPAAAFDPALATELLVEPGPNNTYSMTFKTQSDEEYFKMRVLAFDGVNEYFEDILFGPKIEARAKKDVVSELAEGGQIEIDTTGSDTTKLGLDPGAITPASITETTRNEGGVEVPVGGFLSALPNFQLSRTQSQRSVAMQKLVESVVASDVYEIDLADAQMNRPLTLTLNFNRDKVGENELNHLVIGRYNPVTGEWEVVKGIVMADPLTGTVSIDVDSIGGTNASPAPKARFNGGRFVINRAASTTQNGMFAVFTQDPNSVMAYAGRGFAIFNFPNPFDLKSKNVTLTDVTSGPSQTVRGTVIKYALPAAAKSRIKFYVYNLAGELVKTLDEGDKDGGYYYYTEWDGMNENGEECASGVYFLIAKSDGKKLNAKPLKMAILK